MDRPQSAPAGRSGRGFVLLAAALCVSGCAFRTQATGMAVDYNDFVAQTTNRQTVLNILRAREREPMHFTSFAEVFGQIRGQGTASIGGAFNGDSGVQTATDTVQTAAGPSGATTGTTTTTTRTLTDNIGATNFTPSLGVQVTTGTDFRVQANATDEFYRGILNPIPAATVVHYLRQGFPADLLSHLLIGRLEFHAELTRPDGTSETVHLRTMNNSPDDPAAGAEFTAAIRCRQLDYAIDRQDARTLPLPDLSGLAPVPNDTIRRIRPVDGGGYQLTIPAQTNFNLLLSEPNASRCVELRATLSNAMEQWVRSRSLSPRAPASPSAGSTPVSPSAQALAGDVQAGELGVAGTNRGPVGGPGEVRFSSKGYFDEHLPEGWRGDLFIDVTLRSVQGVLYYLGEYIRSPDGPLLEGDCGYCLPIIRVLPSRAVDRRARFVEVAYRGTRYSVPLSGGRLTPEYGRSSQTIDIVQQLLNLNRRATDLPTTPLLRVTN